MGILRFLKRQGERSVEVARTPRVAGRPDEDLRHEQVGAELCRLGRGDRPGDLVTLLRQNDVDEVTRTRLQVLLRELYSRDFPAARSAYYAMALTSPGLRTAHEGAARSLRCTVVGSRHEVTTALWRALVEIPADIAIVTGGGAMRYMIDEPSAMSLVAVPDRPHRAEVWPGPPLPMLAALELQVRAGQFTDPADGPHLLVRPCGGMPFFPLGDGSGAADPLAAARNRSRIAVHLVGATALDHLLRIWAFAGGTDGPAVTHHLVALDDPLLTDLDVLRLARCVDEDERRAEDLAASGRTFECCANAGRGTRFVGDEAQLVWATAAEADIARGDFARGARALARAGAGADALACLPVCLALAEQPEAAVAELRMGRIASAAVAAKVGELVDMAVRTERTPNR